MRTVPYESKKLMLVPWECGLLLLDPCTGCSAKVPPDVELYYDDEDGRAYLAGGDGDDDEAQWVDDKLGPGSVCFQTEDNGPMYINTHGGARWLHQLQKTFDDVRTVALHGAQEHAIAVYASGAPRQGARLYWTARDVQHSLALQLSSSYATSWVAHQFDTWLEWASTVGLSSEHFVRSDASHTQHDRMGKRPREAGSTLFEFPVSIAALVALLSRWSSTLKGGNRAQAMTFLSKLMVQGIPSVDMKLKVRRASAAIAEHVWPASVSDDAIDLVVRGGRALDIAPLLPLVPDLKSAMRRTSLRIRVPCRATYLLTCPSRHVSTS